MQDRYPAAKRGELQSAVNLQDCFAGIIAVAVIFGFEIGAHSLGLAPLDGFRMQMIFIALACLAAAVLIIRILPADFIRVIGIGVMRAVYRIRTANPENLPAKGGVLLLPNHVTYADAFFISAACPRPVRFVMDEAFVENRVIRAFTSIFDTVTIRLDQPLEAIREIIAALKQGDVVCLFPEGQLTRTGTLCTLQRGFELIARKSNHPLIPAWCDGTWSSIFSFERNRFFRKMPHHAHHDITLAFGERITPADVSFETVRAGILKASSDAIGRNFSGRSWLTRMPRVRNVASKAFRNAEPAMRRRFWINGHQIGMTNALPRRRTLHAIKDDPVLTELPGLTAAFLDLFHCTLRLHDHFDGESDGIWIGGDTLRHEIQFSQITAPHIVFHDFGVEALKPVERAGLHHYPGLAICGMVVAMSMSNPPPGAEGMAPQLGHKLRSWGKLLPGWHLERCPETGTIKAFGPAAPDEGLPLPAGCSLDDEGFLVC
jgi:acyl-[acyl-carrier-protein]-phospholipid O-acyltransferase/long-chain-fatty-acid--[acyl-carrier-protein] ligase